MSRPQTAFAHVMAKPAIQAALSRVAKKSLVNPGKFVRLPRDVWQQMKGALHDDLRPKLDELLTKELYRNPENDTLKF
jgi:hypothetical protein